MNRLLAREHQWRQAIDTGAFVENRVGVVGRQGLDASAAQADPIARRGTGLNHDVIDTCLGQECANRRPCPVADLGDGEQRSDADDDAKHGQSGAHRVAPE